MKIFFLNKKIFYGSIIVLAIIFMCGYFFYSMFPVNSQKGATISVFEIQHGEGFYDVGKSLFDGNFIRSAFSFDIFLLFSGRMAQLKPGEYKLNQGMSAFAIADKLTNSTEREVAVTIPEGSNIYEIDGILSKALIIHSGDLINFHEDGNLEGRLFPDTYDFFTGTGVDIVVQKFLDNWNTKAEPILGLNELQCTTNAACDKNLILASIVEKEVPSLEDQKIVAGILLKRLAIGMYLDLDSTICYAKQASVAQTSDTFTTGCYPLTPLDFKMSSPYNTYSYKGLPPTPIGNPGISAISAVENPESSSYWYYLSDPKTKKTIFAKTLGEQNINRQIYLGL